MVPWSVTMRSALMFDCVLAMGLFTCIGAITVSIDRSDNKPPPTRPSMIANGWRPLTNAYEDALGTNVSPSSSLERNNGPLHPVLGKLQEHMAASEKLKPQRKGKPTSHQDYNPPSILGSFTVLGHAAAKARGEAQPGHKSANNKHAASETRDYTFLIPPPKDAYRFDLDQHRKPILRDSSAFLRQPQFHQAPDPIKAATYFIKGYTSTTNSPSSPSTTKNRHYDAPYVPQLLQPPRYHVKPFESLKVSANPKPYFQPPGTGPANDFGKDKRLTDHRQNFDKFHNEHASINPTGNFFGQVNHPGYKTSYERDPAFLVHESHEISYITPPSVYNPFNFRPSLPYETLLPPDVFSSSTTAPTTPRTVQESNKYRQQVSGDAIDSKRPVQISVAGGKQGVETGVSQQVLPTAGIANTYYVSESQDLTPPPSAWPIPKSKYPSDINEVLPRVNPPSIKFNQGEVNVASNQIPQAPKVVFIGPQTQQPQFQTPVLPVDVPVRPVNGDPEYETPESISLKHFNEQQYLIQQQLLHRDRQRLAEQERQQQLEIEKQQQEELKRRQQELRQLLERQKQEEKEEEEEARLAVESARNQTEKLAKVTEEEGEGKQPPRTIQLAGYEITNVSTDEAAAITEESSVGEQPKVQQSQVTQPEPLPVFQQRPTDHLHDISKKNQADQANYREQQAADLRPQRPHKPSRDQYRRRKPSTTAVYEPTPPTEAPLQVPETSVPVTLRGEEVGLRATPETVTLAAQPRPRTRRPGAPLRRRRPTTTTAPSEPTTEPSAPEDFLKFERQEEEEEATRQADAAKKRRIKPVATQPSLEEVTEKKTNIRKRPGHRNRVNPGEPFEAEIVTEIVHAPLSTYKSQTESYTTSNEYSQLVASGQPTPNQQFDYTESQRVATVEERQRGGDSVTPSNPFEYQTDSQGIRAKDPHENPNNLVTYNPSPESVATNIPLEDLFVRTEGNHLDRGTGASSTGQSNVVATTTQPPPTSPPPSTQPPSTSTARSHKIRPIRYGNATRPRFSIKDYKSRMDYKSRLAQISSTTELPKQRGGGGSALKSQQSQQSGGEGGRETTGRYKYVSRVNYRTSSSPNPPSKEEYATEEGASSSTTERSNRFVPKRRPINGNVYRSRVNSSAAPSRNHYDAETGVQSKPGTARPENVFSSSVRRRPPVMKGRPTPHQSSTAPYQEARDGEGTEMAAEETSFYSAVTSMGAGNEVGEKEGAATTSVATTRSDEEEVGKKEEAEVESGMIGYHSRDGMKENGGGKEVVEEPVAVVTEKTVDESQLRESWGAMTEQYSTARIEETTEIGKGVVESTTKFEIRSEEEEELFAKASQSVADLTSSASALYDKPGMFKAVSPESRIAASHFKIPTDEPTLPIEAFFQELSRKS